MIAAATRLHLRSIRFLIPFFVQVSRIRAQAREAPGCRGLELRKTRGLAFWTCSLWDSAEALAAFSQGGAHRAAQPRLSDWCDEAVHGHWEHAGTGFPSWDEACRQLAAGGRLSRLARPSAAQRAGRIVLD